MLHNERLKMTAKLHLLSTTAIGMFPLVIMPLPLPIVTLYLTGLMIGALWPDCDEPSSYIGARLRGISDILKALLGHRGVTHTLAAVAFYTLLIAAAYVYGSEHWQADEYLAISTGFLLGNILHALGDMTTKEGGIALFYPLSKARLFLLPSALRYTTGGWVEVYLLIPIFTLILAAESYSVFGAIWSLK